MFEVTNPSSPVTMHRDANVSAMHAALCCATTFVGGCLLAHVYSSLKVTPQNPSSTTPKQSFILLVDVTFSSITDRDEALRLWAPVAQHCRDNEPGTLTYEAGISDSDPKRIVFVERYTTKEDAYLEVHRASSPFRRFRSALTRLDPQISGHSYIATDIGYM